MDGNQLFFVDILGDISKMSHGLSKAGETCVYYSHFL
jgi:hypothetical protein